MNNEWAKEVAIEILCFIVIGAFTDSFTQYFIAGTLILTSLGLKKIEEIKVGDKVWSYNEKTKKKELKKVKNIFRNKTKKWLHLIIKHNEKEEEIICTPKHRFYIEEKGWTEAFKLLENDELLLYNNIKCKVIKKQLQHLENEETTYNFEVEDNHNYFVGKNSILVHNHCGNTNGDDATIDYDDLNPNEKGAYDGYSKNGWRGNYKGQTKGTCAGGKWDNAVGQLPDNVTYQEFDVNSRIPGMERDKCRFVVSSDGKIYLTRDHYLTLYRIIKR